MGGARIPVSPAARLSGPTPSGGAWPPSRAPREGAIPSTAPSRETGAHVGQFDEPLRCL